MDSTTVEEQFNDILATLDQSLQALSQGGAVNAHALEEKAQQVCQLLSQLPPHEAKQFEPKLRIMIERFSSVSQNLQSQKQDIEQELSGMHERNTAKSAYSTAAALDTTKNNDST